MKMRKFLAIVLSLCMVLTLMPLSTFAAEADEIETTDLAIEELNPNDYDIDLTLNTEELETLDQPAFADDENVKVLIVMEEASVIENDASAVVDDDTVEQMEQLEAVQEEIVAEIETTVLEGESLDVRYNYTWLLNGISALVPYGTISEIEKIEGVKSVLLQRTYEVCESEVTSSEIMTNNDGVMIGRESTWGAGYTGEGMTIAVIDTGLDTDHQNFQALDASLDVAVSAADISAVLPSLNASQLYSGLTIDDVYCNSKVVYGFNYCDDNTDFTHDSDSQGAHGTHVAGIAAANKVDGSEVVGVAPDAQLMVMKVFGQNGGAYDDDILAALQDAMMLGADVINLSLGSPAGSTTSGWVEMDEFYDRIAETDIVLSISAGNNYTSGYGNTWGTDINLTTDVDNGVAGSPGVYHNVLSVASVENVAYPANYIDADGYRIGYSDSGPDYDHATLTTLTGEYELVYAGLGDVTDFEGLDMTGKVALVQRGILSFAEKCDNAAAAGAVGCIVFNNTSGSIGLNLTGGTSTIPCVSISLAGGSYLVSALAENPALTVSFPAEMDTIPNENAYNVSDFSSWGPAPNLTLEPDIAAPGGNIYSTVDDGGYEVMSGTSMAAPNLTGMSALVMQYVRDTFGTDVDSRTLVRDLLMSTSVPLVYDDETGLTYSPRSQGSGLANAFNAITTQAYLTVAGSDTAKAELGDDGARTGVYDFTFDVHNFGSVAQFYTLSTTAQTEGVISDDDGNDFMSGTPVALSASTASASDAMVLTYDVNDDGATGSNDAYWIYQAVVGSPIDANWTDVSFRYDTNCSEGVDKDDVQAYLDALVGNDSDADLEATVLMVAAGETASVSINVTLSDDDKAYLDFYYTNGGYVEGYTYLTALRSGSVDLSLPYLGFYGDWGEAPVLDDNVFYWDYYNSGGYLYNKQWLTNILFTDCGLDSYGDVDYYYLGMNAYLYEEYDPAHFSLSPNGDGYMDNVVDFYISMMRNAAEVTVSYTDANTDEVYYSETISNVSKSVYYSDYGQVLPFIYSWYSAGYDCSGLPNNTEVILDIGFTGFAEGDETETLSFPITVDLEAPTLLSAEKLQNVETGEKTLKLTFKENVSTAVVALLAADGSDVYYMDGVADVEEDADGYQTTTVSFDVTDLPGKVMLCLGDYALNEAYYGLNLNGEGTNYGDLVAFQSKYDYDSGMGYTNWVSFDADVDMDETVLFSSDADFVCAEYVNGYVFAQTEDGNLYGFSYKSMLNDRLVLEDTYITTLDNVYQDLAYSYVEGQLFGLYTYEHEGYPTSEIYTINLNGEYYDSNLYTTVAPYQENWFANRGGVYGLAMAIDDAGSIYILGPNYDWDTEEANGTAHLWVAEHVENNYGWGSYVDYTFQDNGDTGLTMDYLQSMTWDHNAEKLYWARFGVDGYTPIQELYEVSVVDGAVSCTKLGDLSGETWALFAPLTAESAAKEEHANVPAMDSSEIGTPILTDDVVTLNVGGTKTLNYNFEPWYTAYTDVVWSSSDESVVTVSADGTVTAVDAGSAVVTVANAADESKCDTVTVEVTALDLEFEGIISAQTAGVGSTTGTSTYKYSMVDGASTFGTVNAITASDEMNFGLSLATSAMGRGSIWACEYGNTGMIYEIDPATGAVKDALMPIDGNMMFGLTYSESQDTFAGIMNMNLYVDLEMTHEEQEIMMDSYDEDLHEFTYHRINMLDYLIANGGNFVTGETGQGASSEIVFCGITSMDYTSDAFIENSFGMYMPSTTLVVLDNVGRLWYIDEIKDLYCDATYEAYGYVTYNDAAYERASMTGTAQDGVFRTEVGTDADGQPLYNVYAVREIVETPLTDMFREGTMPRITYHFSDIEFAGYTEAGAPMFALSLYDYWNNGTTNELYLYVDGVGTGEYEWDANWNRVEIKTPASLYNLGNTGDNNIIATIHSAEVTGGVDPETTDVTTANTVNTLTAGVYTGK